MPTSRAEQLTGVLSHLLLATVASLFCPSVTQAGDYGNEVSVLLEQGRIVATSLVSGRRAIPLAAQETALGTGTGGLQGRGRALAPAVGFFQPYLYLGQERSRSQ